MTLPACNIVSG